ncbi:hypothetical protein RRG08_028337 [Elysia crispata]|uniref:Uncharacterized protein n=1 Tax=Elysia crispata TaxID=231223 RepID=A0AAE1E5M3_9GAST|nr:hypothetical protein RRG08_028337 [Elysia crispata]
MTVKEEYEELPSWRSYDSCPLVGQSSLRGRPRQTIRDVWRPDCLFVQGIIVVCPLLIGSAVSTWRAFLLLESACVCLCVCVCE